MRPKDIRTVLDSMTVLVDTREQDTERARWRYAAIGLPAPYCGCSAAFCEFAASASCPAFRFAVLPCLDTCGESEFRSFLAEKHLVSAFGNFEVVVFVVGDFDVAQLQHLEQVIMPMLESRLFARAESFQLVEAVLHDFFAAGSLENVRGHRETDAFAGALDGRKCLLHEDGSVEHEKPVLSLSASAPRVVAYSVNDGGASVSISLSATVTKDGWHREVDVAGNVVDEKPFSPQRYSWTMSGADSATQETSSDTCTFTARLTHARSRRGLQRARTRS